MEKTKLCARVSLSVNMPSQVLYPWTRFWMPSGTQIEHDERGYFADPEAKDRTYRANESRTTFSRLADTSAALILCGPPGSGKSTEIEGLRRGLEQKKGCAVLFYRAAALGNGNNLPQLTVQHKIWKEARLKDESLTLIVDGIDEALAREDTIIAQLLEVMNSDPLARLKVILTCRTADWQSSDDEYLREKFDVGEAPLVHHLCPLRWRDVAGAAAKHPDINSATFSLALWENGADSLAAWPITLKMLLREPEKLGGSRLDFYREYAGHMLNEWNDSRCRSAQSKFPHNQKLQIARRIAALTMFGAKYGVVSNGCGTPESGLLTTGDILAHDPREKLANQAQFDITEQAVDEVLATNLFECGNCDGVTYTPSHTERMQNYWPLSMSGSYLCEKSGASYVCGFATRNTSRHRWRKLQLGLPVFETTMGSSSNFFARKIRKHCFVLTFPASMMIGRNSSSIFFLKKRNQATPPRCGPSRVRPLRLSSMG